MQPKSKLKLYLRKPTSSQVASIIKYLAYALMLFALFLLFRINGQTNQISTQTKFIATASQATSQENQRHIDCIAQLFARYTRDQKAITIQDLRTCQASEATNVVQTSTTPNTSSTVADTKSANGAQTTPITVLKTKSLLHQVLDPVLNAPKNLINLF